MSLGHSPRIVTNGMVLCLDAANPKNFNLTEVEFLIVAGGGGGGKSGISGSDPGGGGGGAGGVIIGSTTLSAGTYTITVGDGGSGTSDRSVNGSNGQPSSAFGFTAVGGGGGGSVNANGLTGGSGGGAGGNTGGNGQGTAGQGNAGGNCTSNVGGGGGGAGSVGASPGNGGSGITWNGYSVAGGGGGGARQNNTPGSAIAGFGGSDGAAYNDNASAASPNTGGGGGGCSNGISGNGGSGIVIVRYPGPQKAIGGTVTSVGGYTIHTFTTVGSTTFTPLVATNNSAILGLSDLSGNGNFGTSGSGTNSPTYSTSNQGSIVFDGSNDYISIPSQFDAQAPLTGYGSFTGADTNAFTLEIWIKTSQISGTNAYTAPNLIGRDNGDIYSNLTLYNGYVYFVHYNSAWLSNLKSTTMVANNVWHQVVYVNNTNETGIIYIDGISEVTGSSSISGTNYFSPDYIGRGYSNSYFQGSISICKFYDRALSAAEISQNFNALRGRFGI